MVLTSICVGLGACYVGSGTKGLPCTVEEDCGPGLECKEGYCGGRECSVDEVNGECPCMGPIGYECVEIPTTTNKIDILLIFDNSEVTITEPEAADQVLVVYDEVGDALAETLLSDEFMRSLTSYRVAVTTTDHGNPACDAMSTTPEYGEFVLSSCLGRLDDFGSGGEFDGQEVCTDLCSLDSVSTTPTKVDGSPETRPRPWVEGDISGTNLESGVDLEDALPCILPQGFSGCGFEQQLESLHSALSKTDELADPESNNHGFLRADANLLVLIVTTEFDSSYNPDWATIYEPTGNRVFWTDPNAMAPSVGVGWNAGVSCVGPGPTYDSCEPQDHDVDGNPTTVAADAVLHPVARYRDLLASIEADKKALDPSLEVIVTLIAGFPSEYDGGSITYADAVDDPDYQLAYGIGPGCLRDGTALAAPPVRMRALASEFPDAEGNNNMFSFCDEDFGPVFDTIIDTATTNVLCLPTCAADKTASVPGVQPECLISYVDASGAIEELAFCDQDPETGNSALLDDQNACVLLRSGAGISSECQAQGANVQFAFLVDDDFELPPTVYVSCEPSSNAEVDCPVLTPP